MRETQLAPASPLGAVHGGIGTSLERRRAISFGQYERDSDAGTDLNGVSAQGDWLVNLRDDGAGNLLSLGRISDANQGDDELVTARPSDQISPSGVAFQDSGHVTQHMVAALVSVGIVDLFEKVQIDRQNSELGGSLP